MQSDGLRSELKVDLGRVNIYKVKPVSPLDNVHVVNRLLPDPGQLQLVLQQQKGNQ